MTDKIDDGGPAFPQESKWHTLEDEKIIIGPHVGISMRDYFAAAAMTGLITMIARQRVKDLADGVQGGRIEAAAAYAIADAMLAARKAKP